MFKAIAGCSSDIPTIALMGTEQGKGMDDYIQANGIESFREDVLDNAIHIKSWEKQFTNAWKEDKPSGVSVGKELAERHRSEWLYHDEQETWRIWNGQTWEAKKNSVFNHIVYNHIKSAGIKYQSNAFMGCSSD